jgi:hypothetical protein
MGACIESVSHRFFLASDPTRPGAKRIKRAAEREHKRAGWRLLPIEAAVVLRVRAVAGLRRLGRLPTPDDRRWRAPGPRRAGRAARGERARLLDRPPTQRARVVSSQEETAAMLDLVCWANRRLTWLFRNTHAIVYGGPRRTAVLLKDALDRRRFSRIRDLRTSAPDRDSDRAETQKRFERLRCRD